MDPDRPRGLQEFESPWSFGKLTHVGGKFVCPDLRLYSLDNICTLLICILFT
jgi:hypothetical protein